MPRRRIRPFSAVVGGERRSEWCEGGAPVSGVWEVGEEGAGVEGAESVARETVARRSIGQYSLSCATYRIRVRWASAAVHAGGGDEVDTAREVGAVEMSEVLH